MSCCRFQLTLVDWMEIHYSAESNLLLIGGIQPEDEILQHVRICPVGIVET